MRILPLMLCGLVVSIALILGSCRKNDSPQDNAPLTTVDNSTLPEGFEAFYERFHTDSLYQIAHIAFPLRGNTSTAVQTETYWQKNDWKMHRLTDMDDYEQRKQSLGDLMVVERLLHQSGLYGIERRFTRRRDGEWEMIYYTVEHAQARE